jgi:hypothetical protein
MPKKIIPNTTQERDFTKITKGAKENHHNFTKKYAKDYYRSLLSHRNTLFSRVP